MPIKDYPFLYIDRRTQKIHIGGPNSRPYLWIKVKNPKNGNSILASALIDTGATESAFPAKCASQLGHKLRSVPPKNIRTANRNTLAFAHTSTVEILGIGPKGHPDISKVLYSMPKQLIDYTIGLDEFLLGQNNFLNNFILKIDYPKQKLSIYLP
ncbi:MAG: retroviral-like aspartic protease family protein [Sedimentisphaerales bacterium]|nr:retroviral-like aspartic protease family protein [Sedimentisphaerales bacterium]